MPYDIQLASRIRQVLLAEPGLSEKRMFGGLAFMLDATMAVCAGSSGGLMVRVDPALLESLTELPHARPFEMRGQAMSGWLHVDGEALGGDDDDLRRWVAHGVARARYLAAQ